MIFKKCKYSNADIRYIADTYNQFLDYFNNAPLAGVEKFSTYKTKNHYFRFAETHKEFRKAIEKSNHKRIRTLQEFISLEMAYSTFNNYRKEL